jgi:hypothetical protein
MILKNYTSIYILLLYLFSIQIMGQTPLTNAEIKSPQSYAFEKYGNVPVNLYMGAIDLKIPITTIGNNEVNISTDLTYDSSGFVPHKKSDAAGIGWSILAGGRITRIVNGTADEYIGNNLEDAYQVNPYGNALDLHGFIKGTKSNSATTNVQAYNLNGGSGNTNGTWWWMGSHPNRYETEPDEFRFNAMGLSGKFIMGNNGDVLVESSDPNIKVDLSQMALYGGRNFCVPLAASIITITDGKGTKYIFGGDLSKYEISYSYSIVPEYPNSLFGGHPMISAFSLSKIIFTNGREITFDYEVGTLSNDNFCHLNDWFNLRENSKILSMDSYSQDGGRTDILHQCAAPYSSHCMESLSTQEIHSNVFVLLKKSVLKSIKYLDDEIKINYTDTGYPIKHFTLSPFSANKLFNEWVIDNVETYHKNILVKKTQLSYEHLGGEFKRPFLKSVVDLNSDKTYAFEYSKTNNLPAYFTKGIDHWGYWNGKNDNTKLAPLDTYNYNTGDYTLNNTFRDADPQYYDVALLAKVIYPTKGFSTFEYEPHYYGKRIERTSSSAFLPTITNNDGLAGGARIKKILNYSEYGTLIMEKQYQYTASFNSSLSSGLLMNWPRYFYWFKIDGGSTAGNELALRTSSNVQRNSLDSYNVGYSKVFEIENNKGYTEHNFTTYETHPDTFGAGEPNTKFYFSSVIGSVITPLNLYMNYQNLYGVDKSILRGRVLSQKYFSQTDLVNPIKKIEYEYYDNTDYNPNNSVDNNNYVTINHLSGFWVQAYKKYMNATPTKKVTTTDYYGTIPITTNTENLFDDPLHLNLSKTNNTSSDNSLAQTTYKYARGNNNPLVAANMVGIPLETEVIKDNKTISRVETKYLNSAPTELLPSSVVSYDKQNISSTDLIFDKYDNKGNLQQFTNKDGLSTTMIWGYNQTKPIAKIVGAKFSDIQQSLIDAIVNASATDNNASPNNDETSFLSQLNSFRNHSSMTGYQITTYTYDPLVGVRSITPPSGIRENYLYDTAHRLNKVVDNNGKILKEYTYNYKPNSVALYHNVAVSKIFRNLTCDSNSVGSPVTYSVPANQYTSTISQADADYQAEIDLNTNGQALANANSICMPLSCPVVFNSSLDITGTSSVYAVNSAGHFVLTLSFTTGPNSTTLPWDGDPGVKIATINGNCRPSDTILGGNMQAGGNLTVFWSVRPNGDIYIDNTPPPANNSSQTWVLEIAFY